MEYLEKIFDVGIPDSKGNVSVARDILDCAKEYQGSVYIEKDGRTVSARSLLGILSLGLQNSDTVKVRCSGADEFFAKLCLEKIGSVIC